MRSRGNAKLPVRKEDVAPTLTGDDLRRALTVMEGVAEGAKLRDLTGGPDQPKKGTFLRWLILYPELKQAFDAAREISAYDLEDKALDMTDNLIGTNDFNGTKVRMYEVAMNQLRWSATRRNPGSFGEKAVAQTVVPIQINTTLDIGQPGGGQAVVEDNIYAFAAKVGVEAEDAEVEELEPGAGVPPPLNPLTSALKPVIPRGDGNTSPKRRPKGHTKSLAAIKGQITKQRNKVDGRG